MADFFLMPLGFPVRFAFTSSSSFANFTLNQNTDAIETIFQAEEAMSITRLAVRLGTITGTSPTYRISLQGVDASGNPDGTVKGGGSPASATFNPSSLGWSSGTLHWITLDNAYSCSRGEALAWVVDYSSGTIDGSNFASFTSGYGIPIRFPYAIHNDNGSRTRQTPAHPIWGYGSASRKYGHPLQATGFGDTWNSGSTPSERGIKFTLPADWGSTYKIAGVVFAGSMIAGGSTVLRLYSGGGASDTTVLQSVTHDHDWLAAGSVGVHQVLFTDSALATLNFGDTYRIGLAPQDGNNFNLVAVWSCPSADDFDAYPLGQGVEYTSRSGGNWTDLATQRLPIALLISDWTKPTGGGGAIIRQRLITVS